MSTRIAWNLDGFKAIRRDPAIVADMERRAESIADAAGPGHETKTNPGKTRTRVRIATDTYEAKIAERDDLTLTSAIDAGRA